MQIHVTYKTNRYIGLPINSNFISETNHIYKSSRETIIEHRVIPLRALLSPNGYKRMGVKFRIPLISDFVDKVQRRLRGDKKEDAEIEQVKLKSSNLDSVLYSPDTKIMQVVFKSGGIYHYYNIPEKTYDGLLTAQSKGKFFHKNIKQKNFKFDVIR